MKLHELLSEKRWIGDVGTKWEPPEGFFTRSAAEIASGLKRSHIDLASAMASLNFYMNRAGKLLSPSRRSELQSAKQKLRDLYS